MHRRDFLLSTLLAALAGTASGSQAPASKALADARTIGRAALADGIVPANPASLARDLDLPEPTNRAILTRRWTPRIEMDLKRGDTLYTAGWILSRTEVQLCALIALTDTATA